VQSKHCIRDTSAGLHKDVKCTTVPSPGGLPGHLHVTYNVPSHCLTSLCGIVLDVHGLTMNADIQDANTNMRALGEKHGYIVAQPVAAPDLIPFNHWGKHAEDALVAWVHAAFQVPEWQIDKNRVHFMGFSEGASLTWDMVERHADLFASVVVMEYGHTGFNSSMRHIPVLFQNGIYDLNWALAKTTLREIKEAWSTDNGTYIAGDGTFNRTRYVSDQGVHFDFLVHGYVADYVGTGHCFPGSNDTQIFHPSLEVPLVGPFGCPGELSKTKASYFIGDEAMQWFLTHPKQSVQIV